MAGGLRRASIGACAAVVALGLAAGGCGEPREVHEAHETSSKKAAPSRSRARWLVIAPHPDDETLIASGILRRAAEEGADAFVAIMTNGDFDCLHDGLVREGESIAGLAVLGIPEERVYFLGYPDGSLPRLGRTPLAPVRRKINGTCVTGNTTYGARGHGHRDHHSVRHGAPAVYDRESAVADLASILVELDPTDVAITHPQDTHPDHAATYALFRSALERAAKAPRVHRAIVHNGDCWPTGTEPNEPCTPTEIAPSRPTPPLSGRLEGYVAPERIPVPASCLVPDARANPKLRAIAAHASQTRGRPDSYLFSFARSDEAFFPETFERLGGAWRHPTVGQQRPLAEVAIQLRSSEIRSVSLSPPLSIAVTLPRPSYREVARLETMRDATGGYTLAIDPGMREAMLTRTFASESGRVLWRWPLPDDLWTSSEEETFELGFEPRPEDGPVAELTLRLRGEVAGVAVDVAPRTSGDSVAFFAPGSPRERRVVVRGGSKVSAFPSARPAR